MRKNSGFENFCKSSWFDWFIAKPHQIFHRTFSSVVKAAFRVSRQTVCEENSLGKKSFEIDKITGSLLKNLGQLSQSFRQFRQNFILTVESKFWRIIYRAYNAVWYDFSDFGWKNVKFFAKLFLHECTNCLLRQQKKGVSVHFDEKTLFSKVFVFFQNLSDSRQHISSFSPLNFMAGLSKLHLDVQRNISWRKPVWNNLFSKTFFSVFEQKVLGLFTKIFWQISKKAFYVSRGTGYEKVLVKKRGNKQNFFEEFVLTTFGLLVEFFRPFRQNYILPQSNLLMESSICEWNIDW